MNRHAVVVNCCGLTNWLNATIVMSCSLLKSRCDPLRDNSLDIKGDSQFVEQLFNLYFIDKMKVCFEGFNYESSKTQWWLQYVYVRYINCEEIHWSSDLIELLKVQKAMYLFSSYRENEHNYKKRVWQLTTWSSAFARKDHSWKRTPGKRSFLPRKGRA